MESVRGVVTDLTVMEVLIQGEPGTNLVDLPVAIATLPSGDPVVVTRWRPDAIERQRIADGGDVYVYIMGRLPIQPMMVSGETPVCSTDLVEVKKVGVPERTLHLATVADLERMTRDRDDVEQQPGRFNG